MAGSQIQNSLETHAKPRPERRASGTVEGPEHPLTLLRYAYGID